MDDEFEAGFFGVQNLGQYCQNDTVQDMPLSNDVLDGFCPESYQVPAHGGLPSPNISNSDLPASGRQSPFFPSLSPFTSGYEFPQMDGSSGALDDFLDSSLLQQPQEPAGSSTSYKNLNVSQMLSDTSNMSSETPGLLDQPSMISPSHVNMRQCPSWMVPSDRSLCNSYQNSASLVPLESSVEQRATNWPMSTHIPIAPNLVNNTSSASAPANQQHSPTSKFQHFVRHPSHLRYQIHPDLLQYSQLTGCSTGQPPLTMSSSSNFASRQEWPSYSNNQNPRHAPHPAHFRKATSAYNQSRGSPVLQNYQSFQESSLRSPVTSTLEQDIWQARQVQVNQYPEPQPTIQQQPDHTPCLGHHHISQSQENSTNGYPSAQKSSPTRIKRELSPPDSDRSVSTPTIKSQIASPISIRKRRAKRDLKDNEEDEAVVDSAALQTADLTNLDPTDRTNVAALIDAMHNTESVEDNQGMQKTWEKVRRAKAFRIKEVSMELLVSANGTQCALEGS